MRKTQSYMIIIDCLYDANKNLDYLSTAGGMVINREITRMSENAKRKKTYKGDAYSAFSFFMALYSQIFSNQFIDRERKISIKSKHDVSCDGSVRTTISYLTHKLDSLTYYPRESNELNSVYTSVVQDIDVDFDVNSNGYYPKGGKKHMFQEFVIYDKTENYGDYEDRGYKDLYKQHHECNNKKGGLCRQFCMSKLNTKVNYKRDDIYRLENEEMSCDNVNVNHYNLSQFYEQRSELDLKVKMNAFNTLIPPPISSTDKKLTE